MIHNTRTYNKCSIDRRREIIPDFIKIELSTKEYENSTKIRSHSVFVIVRPVPD
jgi:hypothetical protein